MTTIKLVADKTALEQRLERIEEPLKRIEGRIKACVFDLNKSFEEFWSGSDADIEELLNHIGPVKLQQVFEAHGANAAAFNALLESRGVSAPRAISTRARDITVSELGVISLVPLPTPEEETP